MLLLKLLNRVYSFWFLFSQSVVEACVPSYTPDFPGFNIPDTLTTTSPTTTSTTTTTTTTTTSTTTTTTTTTVACPGTGWNLFNGFYYCYVPTNVWQPDALAGCQALNSDLASIQSAAENAFVNGMCLMSGCWIGLKRLCPASYDNTCWAWTDGTDGNMFPYYNWRPSQPDNAGLIENCGQINWVGAGTTDGSWDAIACVGGFATMIPYICKKPA